MFSEIEIQQMIESNGWDEWTMPSEVQDYIIKPDCLMWSSPISHHSCNWVCRVRFSEQEVEDKIDGILSFYRHRGKPFTWSIGSGSTPTDLSMRLIDRGFYQIGTFEGLAFDFQKDRYYEKQRKNSFVMIKSVQTHEEMETFIELKGQYHQTDTQRLVKLRLSSLREPSRVEEFLLAYIGNKAVGAASYHLLTNGKVIHFAESYVLPEFRKRGVYRALLDYRMKAGRQHGCSLVITQANVETSAKILKKQGFRKYCLLRDFAIEK